MLTFFNVFHRQGETKANRQKQNENYSSPVHYRGYLFNLQQNDNPYPLLKTFYKAYYNKRIVLIKEILKYLSSIKVEISLIRYRFSFILKPIKIDLLTMQTEFRMSQSTYPRDLISHYPEI